VSVTFEASMPAVRRCFEQALACPAWCARDHPVDGRSFEHQSRRLGVVVTRGDNGPVVLELRLSLFVAEPSDMPAKAGGPWGPVVSIVSRDTDGIVRMVADLDRGEAAGLLAELRQLVDVLDGVTTL